MKDTINKDILVLGLGNILMGDEGIGVRAIEHMQKSTWPASVRLLDGGTGGFHLMQIIEDHAYVIMIDATMDGNLGNVRVLQPKFASDFPRAMSTHDIGLKDLIDGLAILGKLPPIDLIAVSIDEIQPMRLDLSDQVYFALSTVEQAVKALVDDYYD